MDPVNINLITEVKRRPLLWDNHLENYSSAESSELEWSIIAKIVGLSNKTAKSRWIELRDNFYRELEGVPLSEQNNSGVRFGSYDGRWAYFFKLTFLAGNTLRSIKKESVKYPNTREALRNRPEIIIGFPHKPFVEPFPTISLVTANSMHSEIVIDDSPPSPKKSRPTEVKLLDEEHSYKQPKRKETPLPKSGKKERKIEDDDMLYFKSLLSYIQHIPLGRRLHIRNKFQSILMEELSAINKYEV